jgi:hypothetical protein
MVHSSRYSVRKLGLGIQGIGYRVQVINVKAFIIIRGVTGLGPGLKVLVFRAYCIVSRGSLVWTLQLI